MKTNLIHQISKTIEKRPIKYTDNYAFIQKEELALFKQNTEDVDYILKNQIKPLKVVLMGEVKAGKSTLLNAIVGDQVSPVGVSETTAVIIEVVYADERKGTIKYTDGTKETYSIDKVYTILEENKKNPLFYTNIEKVLLGYPLETLREISIIDTPGVVSVTEENEKTTKEFIQKSDVVLWVLSADHLGQSDIFEQISNVVEYGKPIIFVVTRIDTIEDSLAEVMDYVDREYGYLAHAIFPVSGWKANQSKKNGELALLRESGLLELLDYLQNNIEKDSKVVKESSINTSLEQILSKEIATVKAILETINFAEKSHDHMKEKTDYYKKKIITTNQRVLSLKIANGALSRERQELNELLAKNSKQLLKNDMNQISQKLNLYTSNQYVNEYYEETCQELRTQVFNELENAMNTILKDFYSEHESYKQNYFLQLSKGIKFDTILPKNEQAEDLIEGAKKGAVLGGAYGVAAATYTAVLGPTAAYIGLGAALSAVLPPVLLVGAVTGAAFKFIDKGKRTKELSELIDKNLKLAEDHMAIALKEYSDNLEMQVEIILNENLKFKTQEILNNTSVYELLEVKNKLSKYLLQLSDLTQYTDLKIEGHSLQLHEKK